MVPAYGAYRPMGGTYAMLSTRACFKFMRSPHWPGMKAPAAMMNVRGGSWPRFLSSPVPWRTAGANRRHDKMFHLPGWNSPASPIQKP